MGYVRWIIGLLLFLIVVTFAVKNTDPVTVRYLYTAFYPSIRRLILTNTGTEEDAKDIFQEVLIVLYRKVKEDEFILSSSLNLNPRLLLKETKSVICPAYMLQKFTLFIKCLLPLQIKI